MELHGRKWRRVIELHAIWLIDSATATIWASWRQKIWMKRGAKFESADRITSQGGEFYFLFFFKKLKPNKASRSWQREMLEDYIQDGAGVESGTPLSRSCGRYTEGARRKGKGGVGGGDFVWNQATRRKEEGGDGRCYWFQQQLGFFSFWNTRGRFYLFLCCSTTPQSLWTFPPFGSPSLSCPTRMHLAEMWNTVFVATTYWPMLGM